jgi:hypothetical protein
MFLLRYRNKDGVLLAEQVASDELAGEARGIIFHVRMVRNIAGHWVVYDSKHYSIEIIPCR